MTNDKGFRSLPGVDAVLSRLDAPHHEAAHAARLAIAEARTAIQRGTPCPSESQIVQRAQLLLAARSRSRLAKVINATGVLIHTNLGRVPLNEEQIDAVRSVASHYSNLEYDTEEGRRGDRYSHARASIDALVGSESSLVVNNNAAAVLLVLAGLARDREVIISRGELIEIGGEFRIPDVMAHAGVRLVEVGTTNRTHLADYERAITPETAAILKVHPSIYRVVGFTSEVPAREIARLARGRGVCFFHDLGSGLIEAPPGSVFASEPPVAGSLRDGADLVTFSGDKLLGGPQAGIIAGRAELIEKLSKHPLLRALRVDKMTLAALQATLDIYLDGRMGEIPVWAMATASLALLEDRARAIAEAVSSGSVKAGAVPVSGVAGGGSLPEHEFDSWGVMVEVPGRSCDSLAQALRHGDIPVIARIEDDRLILDVRTVATADDALLIGLIQTACAPLA
ncbi:MAG: L-seryl-tRNA(Sec) selenium transferase [Actinomycetota bacterium]